MAIIVFFYFLPQLSMFSDDTLYITVKHHKVNPDQDLLPTYVQVPAASRNSRSTSQTVLAHRLYGKASMKTQMCIFIHKLWLYKKYSKQEL